MDDTTLSEEARLASLPVDWRSVAAGSVVTAGVSSTLLAFGSGIGLSVMSAAPSWRESSPWLWFLSGLFLVFVALCSFACGGYVAGRMRLPPRAADRSERELRDGMHGLFVWGLAILLTSLLALGSAAIGSRVAAPSPGNANPANSIVGENTIATELDQLFRSDRSAPIANIDYRRAEATRILLKISGHAGLTKEDRRYLASVVANQTGIGAAEAGDRVDRVIAASAQELHRARAAAVLEAFFIAAALAIGAVAAWFSASEGGEDRDLGRILVWNWSWRRERPRPAAAK